MHEITKTSSFTSALIVLPTLGFPKIGHWRKFSIDHLSGVIPPIHSVHCFSCLILILKFHIHIAYHVVTDIVGNNYFVELTIFSKLHINFFIKVLKVSYSGDQVLLWHITSVCKGYR